MRTKIISLLILAAALIIIAFGAYYYLQQTAFQEISAPYTPHKRIATTPSVSEYEIPAPDVLTSEQVFANKEKLLNREIVIEGIATPNDSYVTGPGFGYKNLSILSGDATIVLAGEEFLKELSSLELSENEKRRITGLYQDKSVSCFSESVCYPLTSGKQYQVHGKLLKQRVWKVDNYVLQIKNFKEVPLTQKTFGLPQRPVHLNLVIPHENSKITFNETGLIDIMGRLVQPVRNVKMFADDERICGEGPVPPPIEKIDPYELPYGCKVSLPPGLHRAKITYQDENGTSYEYEWTFEVIKLVFNF